MIWHNMMKNDMIWHDMIWHDNSNVDFKWNISKIITATLIAKISIEYSKPLLFFHFLNRWKNFNYTDNMAQIYFNCTFNILTFNILKFCLCLLDFLLIWSFFAHIFIHELIIFIRVRYTYYSQLFISDRSLPASFLRFFLLSSFPLSSLFFFLVNINPLIHPSFLSSPLFST